MHEALGKLAEQSLCQLAQETLRETWWGKEHDWVNRYVFGYFMKYSILVARGMMRARSE